MSSAITIDFYLFSGILAYVRPVCHSPFWPPPIAFLQLSQFEPQTNLSTTLEMNAPSAAAQKHIDSRPNGKSIRKWLANPTILTAFLAILATAAAPPLAISDILAAHTQRSVTLGANFAISTLANVQIKMLKGSCSTQLHALVTISPLPLPQPPRALAFTAPVCVTCMCVCVCMERLLAE